MLTLAQYLEAHDISPSAFAQQLEDKLQKSVSQQNVYRWTRPPDHADFSVPRPEVVAAINDITAAEVPPEVWYQHLVKRRPSRRRKAA